MKKQTGITMIALVITIIVILILAGVSIATFSGQRGLWSKVSNANEENIKAEDIEQIDLAYDGIMVDKLTSDYYYYENQDDIRVTADELEEQLKADGVADNGKEPKVSGSGDLTVIMPSGNKYKVTQSTGKITHIGKTSSSNGGPSSDNNDEDETEEIIGPVSTYLGEALNTNKYGWKVKDYTVTTEDCPSGVWRLFYQDSTYTYLINDETTNSNFVATDYTSPYTNGSEVSEIGKNLNSKLLDNGNYFTEDNEKINIKFVAWLTDTSDRGMWGNYKNGDAEFAIGSPTLELFIASYNATRKVNRVNLELGKYGYNYIDRDEWLSVSENYGIYSQREDGDCWWLASPIDDYYGKRLVRGKRGVVC